jgi:magnesium-transporting ATPase (P-type)
MVLTDVEWQAMSKEQKRKAVKRVCTMPKVDPDHNMEIVGLLKEKGHIVAMTG